ncbi:MAG: hypothetical protein AB1458_02470 [Bacteroidota bacterium]
MPSLRVIGNYTVKRKGPIPAVSAALLFALLLFAGCKSARDRQEEMRLLQDSLVQAMMEEQAAMEKANAQQEENRQKVMDAFAQLKREKGFAFYCLEDCYDQQYGGYDEYGRKNKTGKKKKPFRVFRDEGFDSLYIGFNIIESCYQQFVGDIKIENDTLKLYYSRLAMQEDECVCQYRLMFSVYQRGRKWSAVSMNGTPVE